MQTAIIIILAVALAVVSFLYYRQGKLLDKISAKYISDHRCLQNFAKAFLTEESKITKQ